MKINWTELRTLATLRRIAKSMERANELEEYRQQREYPPIPETGPPGPRKTVFSRPTVAEWNDKEIGR